jgi:hypothetical protein
MTLIDTSSDPRRDAGAGEGRRAWLDRPLPARALALVRITACGLLTVTVIVRGVSTLRLVDAAVGWEPVGVLAPLGSPPIWAVVAPLLVVATLSGVAATLGLRWRLTGPVFAISALLATTLATSWGHLFHSDNLALLHVGIIALAPAADAWSLDQRRRGRTPVPGASVRYGFPIRLAALVTAVTYVLAGWAKLRIAGFDWLDGETLRGLVAHDNLRKELIGAPSTPLAGPVVRQAWLFGPMALATLVIEFGAPLALLGRRWAVGWCLTAVTFHLGIAALMTVTFWYPLTGLAFVPTLLAAGALRGRFGLDRT